MSHIEYFVTITFSLLLGVVLTWWAHYRRMYENLSDINRPISSKNLKIRHLLLVGLSPSILTTILSYFFPNFQSVKLNWINFFAQILYVTFLIIYLQNSQLKFILFEKRKYIRLGIFTYCLSLPWFIFLAGTCQYITNELLQGYSFEIPSNNIFPISETNHPTIYALLFTSTILAPIYEEILFRGILQNFFSKLGSISAIIITSFLFSFAHFRFGFGIFNLGIVIPVFVSSLFICFLYEKSRSLISCIVFHSVSNTFASAALLLQTFKIID